MPSRTRSCALCRKKRIKCDATLPQCVTCLRFGRQCPGVDDGPLIIDMTKKARHGMQKRKKKPSPQASVSAVQAIQHHASIYQISQQALVMEAFYGRFLAYFKSEGEGKDIRNKASWLRRLPELSVDGSNHALTLAVQATASSYCAIETQNLALTRHAWDLYGHAIQIHNRFLTRSRANVTLHMISTSLLFSFFEAMQATNADAYRSHVYGAAKMFEITDPRHCAEGVLCQIFFHIRTQLAYVQLTSSRNKPPIEIDVKKILHIALDYKDLPIFQRVTTHLANLANTYSERKMFNEGDDEEQPDEPRENLSIKTEIDALWCEYSNATSHDSETLMWYDASTNTTEYRDEYTALTIAYFSATRILLCLTAPQPTAFHPNLIEHSRSILQTAWYMQTSSNGCAYMRMAAPLFLVALHAPQLVQRRTAIGYFQSWGQGSMRGVSDLALEAIQWR
jgi:hypothetical protein